MLDHHCVVENSFIVFILFIIYEVERRLSPEEHISNTAFLTEVYFLSNTTDKATKKHIYNLCSTF